MKAQVQAQKHVEDIFKWIHKYMTSAPAKIAKQSAAGGKKKQHHNENLIIKEI